MKAIASPLIVAAMVAASFLFGGYVASRHVLNDMNAYAPRGEWRVHWSPSEGFYDCFHGDEYPLVDVTQP